MDLSILDRLTPVLRDVFDCDELVVTPQLIANDVPGWDSLGNVRLFVEIERTFSVRFSATEISTLRDVGQLIQRKLRPANS
jgi:acyl carrier protein